MELKWSILVGTPTHVFPLTHPKRHLSVWRAEMPPVTAHGPGKSAQNIGGNKVPALFNSPIICAWNQQWFKPISFPAPFQKQQHLQPRQQQPTILGERNSTNCSKRISSVTATLLHITTVFPHINSQQMCLYVTRESQKIKWFIVRHKPCEWLQKYRDCDREKGAEPRTSTDPTSPFFIFPAHSERYLSFFWLTSLLENLLSVNSKWKRLSDTSYSPV